jgi:glycosyltransferase involved in cell wall biosynthesis
VTLFGDGAAGARSARGSEPAHDRPTCLIVSHSYLEPEMAKNLDALSAYLRVRLLTPLRSPSSVFSELTADHLRRSRSYEVVGRHRFPLRSSLYVLVSVRLGLRTGTDVIMVEYDPWTPLFWQVVLARRLFAPGAALYVAVKKNTFRARPRPVAAAKRLLARRGLRLVEGVLSTSNMAARLYSREFGCPVALIRVIPHLSVDTDTFFPARRPAARTRCVIGYVGRLSLRKGVDVLLRAACILRAQGVAFTLRLVGPLHPELAGPVREAVDSGCVEVYPPVPNGAIAGFLREIDVFVMPTLRQPDHEEHDGRALLEAMASGLPCVGSDSGIITELLAGGRGRVFPAGDAQALAHELRVLLGSPAQRQTMGQLGSGYVQRTAGPDVVARARAEALRGVRRRSG